MTPGASTGALEPLIARHDDDAPLHISRVPAREAAERELSDPRYHQHDPHPLQQALTWFWDRVNDLLNAAATVSPGGWIGLLAITVVVLLLVVALRLRLGALRRTPTTSRTLFTDPPRTAAEHRTAAERHAAAGHWSQAVQERLRGIVLALEERTLLTPGPGRTADEAAVEAGRSLPALADRLRAAARTFDAITYGGRQGTAQEYAAMSALDTDLQRATPQPTGAATGSRA